MAIRSSARLPLIIQGGMGVAISGWRLAHAVSSLGQLGLVAGTALDRVMIRRLQSGDTGGHIRRALDHFPFPGTATRGWVTYQQEDGLLEAAHDMHPPQTAKAMATTIYGPSTYTTSGDGVSV